MKLFTQSILAISALGIASVAMATDPITGNWQTYDGDEPKAIVQITESNGVISGRILSTVDPAGQKFVGRTVISGLKAEGSAGRYSGGEITDPENDKTYRLTATLNGNSLRLTGHHWTGISRSQTWKRQ